MIRYMAPLIILGLLMISPAKAREETPERPPQEFIEQLARDLAELQALTLAVAPSPELRVTSENAELYAGASTAATRVGTARQGQTLPIIGTRGRWYAVQLAGGETAWVQASDVAPTQNMMQWEMRWEEWEPAVQAQHVTAHSAMQTLIERAYSFRDSYRNNPYVRVTGFSLNLGLPPSVGVSFEFKD